MLNALIILDGYGISKEIKGNAIIASGTPYFKSLLKKYPNTQIGASGLDVGLPEGQMGNSEVGHINMGAGRIVYQELTRITKEITDGDFFKNPELLVAIENAKIEGRALHTIGLLSDGGVHSHIEHLFALIKMAKDAGLKNIFIHCLMDGRDVSPTSGADYIAQLQKYIDSNGFGTIASVMGRFYGMDRDNRWERVEKAYLAMVDGDGIHATDAELAVRQSYSEGITDEFILPTIICENGVPTKRIEKNDSIVFFNFRPDRAREITRAFVFDGFKGFPRKKGFLSPTYVGFTRYDETLTNVLIAFKAQSLQNNLGQTLSKRNLKQLRIAETEKYAHVTFFFNSGIEEPEPGEDRVLIPSPKVNTYDLQPEMSAQIVAKKAAELIQSKKYDAMILNFANCDMVGHTGVFDAAVKAVSAVDDCLKIVVDAILSVGGNAIVTADHGNAEKMIDFDGSPFTPHTTNPVPCIVIMPGKFNLRKCGRLCDIAPTLLDMMDILPPSEMTGLSLIVK
ncbi:MAG: 2,3-bisphosphoglycerate-independent phosphoglycerate mutase [Christensenellaceae bacterium]|jgi:2,3-bisphosphoglycerate-independent phosphoglycerate mutase|nr:2,3-bisphosphoglycerate-independent phosphoglycerate mutase [Christensenellaceae bacterium]